MRGFFHAFLVCFTGGQLLASSTDFNASLPNNVERPWLGPELWSNPLPDWKLLNGALVCEHAGGNRNVVILTRELTSRREPFRLRVVLDQLSDDLAPQNGWIGFQIGLRGRFGDYRDAAVFGRGLCAGLGFDGRLFIGNFGERGKRIAPPFHNLTLELSAKPTGRSYLLIVSVLDPGGSELGKLVKENVHPSWLEGLVAVDVSTSAAAEAEVESPRPRFADLHAMATQRGGQARVAFREISAVGKKLQAHPERAFGPILWCQHALQNNGNLKLLAQFPPLGRGQFTASLQLDGQFVAESEIEPTSCTALFRTAVPNIQRSHEYAVIFKPIDGKETKFTGTIRPIPSGHKPLTVAAFSCNDGTGFPHSRLVANVKAQRPDLLAFLGDQIYEVNGGYGVLYDAGERSVLDYLRKYYLHGWVWRDLMRDIPAFAIPDDHDVFHGNLWGNGGRTADLSKGYGAAAQDSGGYKMPPKFVNMVHRTQTGNLPDPFDPTPCEQGITAYYTSWEFGPLDMAIVADRQWKTAPKPLLPEADIFNGFVRNEQWNPLTQAHHPDAQLLGPRQEQFLEYWAAHRPANSAFRIVFSQTPWNCLGTLPEGQNRSDSVVPSLPIYKAGDYPSNDIPTIDFDSNGWPQEKRNRALRLLNQAGAVLHIAGDQHLGSTGRYGIDNWNDGPFWLATPAIANLWPRRWFPREPGAHYQPGQPRYTGEYEDQFGNKMTVLAVANPQRVGHDDPVQISDRVPGYSIIRFLPDLNQITLEVWPYWASPKRPAPDNRPYVGWPFTFKPSRM